MHCVWGNTVLGRAEAFLDCNFAKIKDSKIEKVLMWLLLFISLSSFVGFAFWVALNPDEREHLYSSYMVYHGAIPYKDFFEHHHPLLWYMFAPVLYFFDNDANVLYALRFFELVINVLIVFVIYKIALLVFNRRIWALWSAIIYFQFRVVQIWGISFRPDQLMILFFLSGVLFFFYYVEKNKLKDLVVAYICFLLSLIALQKILFMLVVMGGIILCLPRKKMNLKIETAVLFAPVVGILIFLFYWYSKGAIKDYYELNWLLNLKLYVLNRVYPMGIMFVLTGGVILSLFLYKRANYYMRVVIILYLAQFCIVLWYAPYGHYLLGCYPFLAIISVFGAYCFAGRWVLWSMCLGLVVRSVLYLCQFSASTLPVYVGYMGIEMHYSTSDDEIIGSGLWVGGMRKSALGYYWFGLESIARLDYQFFKRHEFPDLNQIIREKKPQIVANKDGGINNCLNAENMQDDAVCVTEQVIDRNLMADYAESELCFVRIR